MVLQKRITDKIWVHPLDSGRCPVSGRLIDRRLSWIIRDEGYSVQFGVLEGRVILVRSWGNPKPAHVELFFSGLARVVEEARCKDEFVILNDWSALHSIPWRVRLGYLRHLITLPGLKGVAAFGTKGFRVQWLLTSLIWRKPKTPMERCSDYAQCLAKARCWLSYEVLADEDLKVDMAPLLSFVQSMFTTASEEALDNVNEELQPWIPLLNGLNVIREDLLQLEQQEIRRAEELQQSTRTIEELTQNLGNALRELEEIKGTVELESQRRQELHNELVKSQMEMVFALGEIIETRSKETANHIRRVSEYTFLLAKLYGMPDKICNVLLHAAPLHDAGKIGIPDSILNKPGKLTSEEFDVMKGHSEIGYRLLKGSHREILKAAAIIAHQHHEKWNGAGYPRGLSQEQIHPYGRIVALVDVFDALGSDRCYKKAWPLPEVLDLIKRERGLHFDPAMVDLFFENIDAFLAIRDRWPDVQD